MSAQISVLASYSASLDDECLTLSVVTEAHLGLAESDCILALRHAIELLQLSLIDTLHSRLARVQLWRTIA